ncbi:extracellular solute-binding protein [Thermoanaerobacter kivui]|uniref:extracellular solute-binding protein n=1 Tax=Thermoanaerobacter kivui TaxID=2325 RepID=UPI0009FCB0D0
MAKDGLLLHATQKEGQQAFLSGKLAMIVQTIGLQKYFRDSANFEIKTAPFPEFKGKPRKVPAGGNTLSIFATRPEERKAAWEFIKFLNAPEALMKWVKGTGYLPHRKEMLEDKNFLDSFIKENPLVKAAIEVLPDVVPWPSFTGGNSLEVEKVRIDTTNAILSGKVSAEKGLKEAVSKINNLAK